MGERNRGRSDDWEMQAVAAAWIADDPRLWGAKGSAGS
jgi:hypothetical protein